MFALFEDGIWWGGNPMLSHGAIIGTSLRSDQFGFLELASLELRKDREGHGRHGQTRKTRKTRKTRTTRTGRDRHGQTRTDTDRHGRTWTTRVDTGLERRGLRTGVGGCSSAGIVGLVRPNLGVAAIVCLSALGVGSDGRST